MLSAPKKPIKRILKSLLRLYSSFSSEVVSVLLDYLLKTSSSSEFKKKTGDASAGPTIDNVLADWKPVILRFYNKEPELFLNLLKEVLHRIEAREDMKCEEGRQLFFPTTFLFYIGSFKSLNCCGCLEIYFECLCLLMHYLFVKP